METLDDGIYMFSNIVANQYLLVDDTGLTLIDTGLKSNYRTIVRGIQSIGHDLAELSNILITHADGDHCGALSRLKQDTRAAAMTSKPEADAIEAGTSSRELKPTGALLTMVLRAGEPIFRAQPAKIDRMLSPGDDLPVAGGMTVIDSSGHTPGHLSYFLPGSRILFSGDSIFLKKSGLIPSYGLNCWNETRAIESLENQMKLLPRLICGGHGIIRIGSR